MSELFNLSSGHSWGGSYIIAKVVDEKPLRALVDDLPEMLQDKAIARGLLDAANVFKKKGRSNLRARLKTQGGHTGNLLGSFDSISSARRLYARAGFTSKGNHAHLVDLGTTVRRHPVTGTSGRMPANYFWTDARKTEEGKAAQAVYDGIEKAVERIKRRAQ